MVKVLIVFALVVVFSTFDNVECRGRGGGGGRGGGRSGGWGSSRSSSSSRSGSSGGWLGGLFGGSKKTAPKSSSYPKQQWGTTGKGTGTSTNNRFGSGAVGGGGFVNPKSYGGYGSRSSSFGSSPGYAPKYSYRSPGYGTNFGTRFPGGVGAYGGSGFSQKRLGLGVGAGFLGGAMGTMAVMSVYHRYQMYNHMMMMNQYGGGYHDQRYNNYRQGQCYGGCPYNAHCEYGFCECDYGFTKRMGGCYRPDQVPPPRNLENPHIDCIPDIPEEIAKCQNIDLNMVCGNETKTCDCRQDFRWNTEKSECEFFLNVDCSAVTYDTPPSPIVEEAANVTIVQLENESNKGLEAKENLTADEVMATSMLSNVNVQNATGDDIKEAFCRDVDSLSWEFGKYEEPTESSSGYGVLAFILVAITIFIAYKYYKKRKRNNNNQREDNSENIDKNMTNVNAMPMSNQPNAGVTHNPGFQPQPTPIHNLPYQINPPPAGGSADPNAEPAPILPTQPGYNNVYPPMTVNLPAEGSTQQNMPYPPATTQPIMPYPPAGGQPLPAGGQPYPPATGGGLPYPLNPPPVYPAYPTGSQPPYNPNA